MAIIKCKLCGGDLRPEAGMTIAECEYCGSRQTVPKADDEKKLTLFARAGRLRAACDFDKAAGIYEAIIADFPEEAEAYWGLVLCKYGIEYVDDPATGKKIPTCHRSGFDSVLEDANFEQAMENSDIATQLVYREEAKQLERLRRNIISVSSGEKPYDIFICYKETDLNGNRTLDSVLAQDLYTALTSKGYRVFFSRITLQGKLGQAYEPYIFAALNTAKVMLAVGTRYEHYSAVWVKNEWSRYLKLMTQDSDKHLIPCYKDIDPEDIPKEFSHLQGADLGKMGAIQDILFNMEKYIPLRSSPVTRQQMIISEVSSQKIAALLDRGHMALEDGDFAGADRFFEEVLNHDSKNARAYLGKFLISQHCASLEAYEAKSLQQIHTARPSGCELEPDEVHINQVIEYYGEVFARKYNLKKKYQFDLQYTSIVPQLRQLERVELQRWEEDRLLTKAVHFADDGFAAELTQVKNRIADAYSQAINDTVNREKAEVDALKNRYALHLEAVDKEVAACYGQELAFLEKRYAELMAVLEKETSQRGLRNLAQEFDKLGNFKDSKQKAAACRDSASDMDYQIGLSRLQSATTPRDLLNLSEYFENIQPYKNAAFLAKECKERAEQLRIETEQKLLQEQRRQKKLDTDNQRLAKILLTIFLVFGGILFVGGFYGLYVSMCETSTGDRFGLFFACSIIQVLIYVLPANCFMIQIRNLGVRNKVAKSFKIVTLILSSIGFLCWLIVTLSCFMGSGDINMGTWALCTTLFNALTIGLSFPRKY